MAKQTKKQDTQAVGKTKRASSARGRASGAHHRQSEAKGTASARERISDPPALIPSFSSVVIEILLNFCPLFSLMRQGFFLH